MEPCPMPGCAMGIATEGSEPARGVGSRDLPAEPQFGSPLWKRQGEVALEVPVAAGVGLTEAEAALASSPVESCLQEVWPGAESPSGRKRLLEEAEEDWAPTERQGPAEEEEEGEEEELEEAAAPTPEAKDELFAPALPATTRPRKMAGPSRRKRSRRRKPPLKKSALCRASGPPRSREEGEGPGPSEQNPFLPPGRVPKKRGRKSKAELLLLKLSQECQAAESLCPQRATLATEEEEGPESTPGRRPKRRAAKVALMYLQELAEELTSVYQAPSCASAPEDRAQPRQPRAKRRGRKPKDQKWEAEEDVDFVPAEEEEEGLLQGGREEEEQQQEEEEEEERDLLLSEAFASALEPGPPGAMRPRGQGRGFAPNGLHKSVMAPVWTSLSVTHRLRERLHSPWEFPEWVPSALQWVFLSESEATDYLPGETKSPFFSIRREGLQEDWGVRYRINRFNALQPHEERLDTTFFVGGPVWALEWCPTPEGSCASQCVALYCNPGMDDRHTLAGTYTGQALLQLWDLGPIQQDAGPATNPELAYAIATDHGCIWDIKFCPSGGWEPHDTCRMPPQMSRLGLLAVAFSDGQVLIYSLPHSEALQAHWRAQVTGEGAAPRHAICKVQHVVSLQVGSVQAGNALDCGQCFSLAWMPSKPHQHLAAGFYDGTVALWNLTSQSLLQRVRQPDGSLKLYPFRCFLAHDHAVRHIQWCKANSHFMVTAGNDRKIKFWDMRRLHEPLNSIKRFLSTEMAWLLPYSGITVAQDNCYASYGLCGIHYLDAGYLGFRAYFVAPRKGTVWSISGSDWLNTVAAGDVTGELVAAMMPDLSINPQNIKRPSERRFPIYKADLLPYSLPSKEAPLVGPTERSPVGGRTYGESVAQNYILFQDPDLRSFQNVFRQKPPRSHPHLLLEPKEGDGLGRLQLEAIHKVRFSPNLDCHTWLVSGGQSGLVRLHCLRALASPPSHKLQRECQAQFSAMFHRGDGGGESDTPAGSPPEGDSAVVS